MLALPTNITVHEQACLTLYAIAGVNDSFKQKAIRVGAVEVLLGALRAHPIAAGIQEHGCMALTALIEKPETQAKAVSLGAVPACVVAMNTHPTHAGVQQMAFQLLIVRSEHPAPSRASVFSVPRGSLSGRCDICVLWELRTDAPHVLWILSPGPDRSSSRRFRTARRPRRPPASSRLQSRAFARTRPAARCRCTAAP